MRCAIVGGGAAGLATAYYLSSNHEVVLFEKQDKLGGNVRTLGLNEPSPPELAHLGMDNGVIEFMANKSPCLSRLLKALEVETETIVGGSTSFYPEQGRPLHMRKVIGRIEHGFERIPHYMRWLPAIVRFSPVLRHYFDRHKPNDLGSILGDDLISRWMKGLMMYGYSMPYADINDFPVEIAADTFKRVITDIKWMRISGGTYSYLQKIVDKQQFEIRKNCQSLAVARIGEEVRVTSNGEPELFDHIIFATPPHEILPMLSDPTGVEMANLSGWRENVVETVIHTDASIYDRWNPPEFTEFDIFELANGTDAGYNAYLNRLLRLPTDQGPHYFLAFNLDAKIRPEKIIHRCTHRTTCFDANVDTRSALRQENGKGRTHYAGAYLYDGLHEGAIQSAFAVVDSLPANSSL